MKNKILFLAALLIVASSLNPIFSQAQTSPAANAVTINFFLPGEADKDIGEQIEKAERLIHQLLDIYKKHQQKKTGEKPKEVVTFSAPGWSQKISRKVRSKIIQKLISQWGSRIEIISGNQVWALHQGHLRLISKKDFEKIQKKAETRLDPLLQGQYTKTYDGGKDGNSKLKGNAHQAVAGKYADPNSNSLTPVQAQPGIQLSYLDRSVNPCQDFYHFACGTWIKKNPIPAEYPRWGTFDALARKNKVLLRKLLNQMQEQKAKISSNEAKLSNLYGSCMDKKSVDKEGGKPLFPEIKKIDALSSKKDLAQEIAHLQMLGVPALFNFGSEQDYQNADKMIAALDQGGFALPDRDYYLKKNFAKDRAAYLKHMQKMLELAGESSAQAQQDAGEALAVETALAQIALNRVSQRDPLKVNHKITLSELEKISPDFNWSAYFKAAGTPKFKVLNAADYGFIKNLSAVIRQTRLQNWKSYLKWQLVHAEASALSSAFVNEDFAFFGKRLRGSKKLMPRWERCVNFANNGMGEALGKIYVDKNFPPEAKKEARKLLLEIEKSMNQDIHSISWMDIKTKEQALKKLKAMKNKVGYPKRWRDYSKLQIKKGDNIGNYERAAGFEFKREIGKIGKKTDRSEWQMTPPTVNAYYDPAENDMNFPAGILQPPFYDPKADLSSNLGAIGAVEGHELTHGFDDQGRMYDAKGNLRNWWTPQDASNFKSRAQCLVNQYSQYVVSKDPKDPQKDVKINGKLTLGENTADNGGIHLAYSALERNIISQPQKIGGFTPEQRFFIAWAQTWCANQTEQSKKLQALTDPHSLPEYRANGAVSNMPEFGQAFSCPAKSPMVRQNACRVW